MGFVGWLGRALGPIVLEHSLPMLRDWWKTRLAQPKNEQFQQLAKEVEELKVHAAQVAADLDLLNNGFSERENHLRKWVLTLLIWNMVISAAVVALAFLALHR